MCVCVCVTARCPAVTVRELRDSYLSGQRVVNRGSVIVRIINKSHLMYYGKTARNSECPYKVIERKHACTSPHKMKRTKKLFLCNLNSVSLFIKALLEVCDRTGSVCVVLWNSVCVNWYCSMRPGDIISLSRYRVKPHYQAERDIGTYSHTLKR